MIGRTANPGEVIAADKEILRIADLSSVWVMGQVYVKDLAKVVVGSGASITSDTYLADVDCHFSGVWTGDKISAAEKIEEFLTGHPTTPAHDLVLHHRDVRRRSQKAMVPSFKNNVARLRRILVLPISRHQKPDFVSSHISPTIFG